MDVLVNKNCLLCNKELKIKPSVKEVSPRVFEIEFQLYHPTCRKLNDKYKKLNEELLNVEYRIFETKNSHCNV